MSRTLVALKLPIASGVHFEKRTRSCRVTTRLYMSMLRILVASSACIAIGITVAFGTLFVPIDVPDHEALRRVEMGWPFPFVDQDLSRYDPDSWPQTFRINAPQEHATALHLEWLAIDAALFSTAAGALIFAFRRRQE